MKLPDLVSLIGTKSTDPRIVQWFEQYNLGTPPKTITPNQRSKDVEDKQHSIGYHFKFKITNDKFYPPVSVKNDQYKFENYLSNISVLSTSGSGKKKSVDPKPLAFWEGYIHPGSSFEECLTYFDHPSGASTSDTFFQKPLNDIAKIKVWFAPDKTAITAIEIAIMEAAEIFSHSYFNPKNEFNNVPQSYSLLVKWLFDHQYLTLSEEVYRQGLTFDHSEILAFTGAHLKHHIWDTQLKTIPHLRSFLFKIGSNNSLEDANGKEINFYIKNLYLAAAGKLEERQSVYNDDYKNVDSFEKSVVLDLAQSQQFLNILTEYFALFGQINKAE
jgi:hypothetical protein